MYTNPQARKQILMPICKLPSLDICANMAPKYLFSHYFDMCGKKIDADLQSAEKIVKKVPYKKLLA